MLRYHIVIRGDVQGVGFRYYTQKNALAFGVKGWVRNRLDGSVEIDAEGDETSLALFLGALKRGSRYSTVESADIRKMDEIMNYRTFYIEDDEW
ncbi:MAG: acylphosphatase [Burkholderiales bacterium]